MEREVEGVEMEMDTMGVEGVGVVGVGVDRAHHASCVPVMTTTGHLRIALSEIALSESVSNRPEEVRSGEECFSSNEVVGPADAAVRWLRSSAGEFGSPTAAAATSNASRRTAIIFSVLLMFEAEG